MRKILVNCSLVFHLDSFAYQYHHRRRPNAVTAILVDDGQADRSRRDALLADKFKHFGIAANVDEKGQFNYCYLLLLSNFEEKQ
jgi:hypothetical protein